MDEYPNWQPHRQDTQNSVRPSAYNAPVYTPPVYAPPVQNEPLPPTAYRPQGTYPQTGYQNLPVHPDWAQRQRNERDKRQLRQHGNRAGLGILAFNIFSTILSVMLILLGKTDLLENYFILYAVNGIGSVLGIFLPYLWICSRSNDRGVSVYRSLGKPYQTGQMLLTLPFGFAICLVANFITGVFVTVVEQFGITLRSPEIGGGAAPLELLIGIITVAVIPALTEEFAMRGAVMQPLRRYGDKFAIVASAILFGVMHGNLVQAPFALIVGLGVGYCTILTGTLWTGVLIHFANNLFSVIANAGLEYYGADNPRFLAVLYIFEGTAILLGIVCAVLMLIMTQKRKLCPSSVELRTGQKYSAFFLAPCMIIALILLAINTWLMIDF